MLTRHAATGSLTGNFRTGKRESCWWHFERSTHTRARVMGYYLVETVRVKKSPMRHGKPAIAPIRPAEAVGIARSTAYAWKTEDATFAALWTEAVECSL